MLNKLSTNPNNLPGISFENYPVFFVDMSDWSEENCCLTGSITSVMDLDDGDKVLLVNDIFQPVVSILATVYYSHATQEGSVYCFKFDRRDIGVPIFD